WNNLPWRRDSNQMASDQPGAVQVAYLEVGNLNGCRAAAQFPDQTVFQMAQIQSGTDKAWIIFISNPRWNDWIGKRKQLRLQLVTDFAHDQALAIHVFYIWR